MRSLLCLIVFLLCCADVRGQTYGEIRPIVNFTYGVSVSPVVSIPVVQYYQPVQYLPIVTMNHVIIERKEWCLLKRYETVPVYQTFHMPVQQIHGANTWLTR